jgi:general secretion pathway protein J
VTQRARSRRGRGERPEAGFTLVEMLVSLTLLAMAAGLMGMGLSSGHRLWMAQERHTVNGETVESAQTLLRDGIERLRPNTRSKGALLYADIDGAPDQFTFITTAADTDRPTAIRRYRLSLDQDGNLVLAWAPSPVDTRVAFTPQVLLHGVEGLEISYFGPVGRNTPSQWQDTWTERATPPQLVRVRLTFGARDPRVWPDLIARPAATVDTQCLVEVDSGLCAGRA